MSFIISASSLHGGCFFPEYQPIPGMSWDDDYLPSFSTELDTEDAMMNKIGLSLKDLAAQ